MKNITYSQNIRSLKENIYDTQFDEIKNLGLLGSYLKVSANLLTYLPKLTNKEHYKFIQDIQFHRRLSSIDQYYPFLLNDLKIHDKLNIIESSYNTSHIFVTYHTGSYRMFIQYLSKMNISFCLVTEERFIEKQGATIQKLYKQIRKESDKLEILSAENPRLIFELINRLRKGVSVVFYIDGNTGALEKKLEQNKNLLKIDFLSHHIYARQGIAFLAYLSKSPIAIVLAERSENLDNIIYINPVKTIELIKKLNRKDYINSVTKILYHELELFLRKNPTQWEGWFYIHKFFENKALLNKRKEFIYNYPKSITLEIDQFIHLIKYDDKHIFLVKKKDYQIMKITNLMFEILNFFKSPKKIKPNKSLVLKQQKFSWTFIKELIEIELINPIKQ